MAHNDGLTTLQHARLIVVKTTGDAGTKTPSFGETVHRRTGDAGTKPPSFGETIHRRTGDVGTKTPSFGETMKTIADKEKTSPLSLPVDTEPQSRLIGSTKTTEKQKKPKQVKRSNSSYSSLASSSPVTSAAAVAAAPRVKINAPPSTTMTSPSVSLSSATSLVDKPKKTPSSVQPSHKKWYSPPPSLRPSPLHINVYTPSPSTESVTLAAQNGGHRTASVAQEHGKAKQVRKVRFGNTTRINLATPAHSHSMIHVKKNDVPNELVKTSSHSSNPLANIIRLNHLIAPKRPLTPAQVAPKRPMTPAQVAPKRPMTPAQVTCDGLRGAHQGPSGQTRPVNASINNIFGVNNNSVLGDKMQPPAFNYRNIAYNKLSPDEVEAASRIAMRPPHEMMVTGGAENSVFSVQIPSPACPRDKSNIGPQFVSPFPLTVPPGTDPGKFLPSKTVDQANLVLLSKDVSAKRGNKGPRDVLPFPMTVAPGTDPGIFMPSWPPIVPGCHPCPVDPLSLRNRVPAARGPSPVIKGHHYLVESLGIRAFRTPILNPGCHVRGMEANDYAVAPHPASMCDKLAAKFFGRHESDKSHCSTEAQHGSAISTNMGKCEWAETHEVGPTAEPWTILAEIEKRTTKRLYRQNRTNCGYDKSTRPPTPKNPSSPGAGHKAMTSVLNELLPVLDARRKMAERYEKETAEICRREMELSRDRHVSSSAMPSSVTFNPHESHPHRTNSRSTVLNSKPRAPDASSRQSTTTRSTRNKATSEFQRAYNRILGLRQNT